MVSGHSVQPFGRPWRLADDLLLRFGSDGDAAVALVSSANSADDEVTNLIEGTSDHQGTAANSLVLSNVTNDGDIQMLVSDNGDSKEFLLANGDTADLQLGHGMATATIKTASGALTLAPASGDIMVALAGSAPAPDTDRVHIWEGSAGSVASNAVTALTIEHSDDTGIQFLTPNDKVNYIIFGDADANNTGLLSYNHDGNIITMKAVSNLMALSVGGGVDLQGNSAGLQNVGVSGDYWSAGEMALTGTGQFDILVEANNGSALEIKPESGTTMMNIDTRPGGVTSRFWDFSAPGSNTGTAGRNDVNQHLMRLKAYTVTMADTTTVTGAWEGMMLELGVPTIAHSGSGTRTVTTASSVHIEAIVAGTDITVTNNRMISTSVADCFLTAAGVWTDTSSTAKVKDNIIDLPLQDVGSLISQIRPRTYRYKDHMEDFGRTRYGAVAEEFPDFLRVPGDASNSAVNSTVLANFSLVASVYLADKYEQLNERLEAIGA